MFVVGGETMFSIKRVIANENKKKRRDIKSLSDVDENGSAFQPDMIPLIGCWGLSLSHSVA